MSNRARRRVGARTGSLIRSPSGPLGPPWPVCALVTVSRRLPRPTPVPQLNGSRALALRVPGAVRRGSGRARHGSCARGCAAHGPRGRATCSCRRVESVRGVDVWVCVRRRYGACMLQHVNMCTCIMTHVMNRRGSRNVNRYRTVSKVIKRRSPHASARCHPRASWTSIFSAAYIYTSTGHRSHSAHTFEEQAAGENQSPRVERAVQERHSNEKPEIPRRFARSNSIHAASTSTT